MDTYTDAPIAFETLPDALRPHAERWALQLLELPDERVPDVLQELLRDVLCAVDADYARDNLDDIQRILKLVGHAIVERRDALRRKTCGATGNA